MPSGTQPEEPDDDAARPDDAAHGESEAGSESAAQVPVHPDDRLWRHPSELARMRAAARDAEAAVPPPPTPTSARQDAATPWVSRIPTSLVIAAGLAVMVASVGSLVTLAQSPDEPDQRPVSTFDGRPAELKRTSIQTESAQADGLMVNSGGLALVATDDPPQTATLTTGRREVQATLRAAAPDLGLAAYQVDTSPQRPAPAGSGASQDLAKPTTTAPSVPRHWKVPTGSSDLGRLGPKLAASSWGPMFLADIGTTSAPPGTPLAEDGTVVGMTILTGDGHAMVVPWPVLEALGDRLSAEPPPEGVLPVDLQDQDDGPMIADDWGDGALHRGDRVEAIDGLAVSTVAEVETIAALHEQGAMAKVSCERSDESLDVDVALE